MQVQLKIGSRLISMCSGVRQQIGFYVQSMH